MKPLARSTITTRCWLPFPEIVYTSYVSTSDTSHELRHRADSVETCWLLAYGPFPAPVIESAYSPTSCAKTGQLCLPLTNFTIHTTPAWPLVVRTRVRGLGPSSHGTSILCVWPGMVTRRVRKSPSWNMLQHRARTRLMGGRVDECSALGDRLVLLMMYRIV